MKTRLLILLLFLYVGGNLVAQNATITGIVTDSETKVNDRATPCC